MYPLVLIFLICANFSNQLENNILKSSEPQTVWEELQQYQHLEKSSKFAAMVIGSSFCQTSAVINKISNSNLSVSINSSETWRTADGHLIPGSVCDTKNEGYQDLIVLADNNSPSQDFVGINMTPGNQSNILIRVIERKNALEVYKAVKLVIIVEFHIFDDKITVLLILEAINRLLNFVDDITNFRGSVALMALYNSEQSKSLDATVLENRFRNVLSQLLIHSIEGVETSVNFNVSSAAKLFLESQIILVSQTSDQGQIMDMVNDVNFTNVTENSFRINFDKSEIREIQSFIDEAYAKIQDILNNQLSLWREQLEPKLPEMDLEHGLHTNQRKFRETFAAVGELLQKFTTDSITAAQWLEEFARNGTVSIPAQTFHDLRQLEYGIHFFQSASPLLKSSGRLNDTRTLKTFSKFVTKYTLWYTWLTGLHSFFTSPKWQKEQFRQPERNMTEPVSNANFQVFIETLNDTSISGFWRRQGITATPLTDEQLGEVNLVLHSTASNLNFECSHTELIIYSKFILMDSREPKFLELLNICSVFKPRNFLLIAENVEIGQLRLSGFLGGSRITVISPHVHILNNSVVELVGGEGAVHTSTTSANFKHPPGCRVGEGHPGNPGSQGGSFFLVTTTIFSELTIISEGGAGGTGQDSEYSHKKNETFEEFLNLADLRPGAAGLGGNPGFIRVVQLISGSKINTLQKTGMPGVFGNSYNSRRYHYSMFRAEFCGPPPKPGFQTQDLSSPVNKFLTFAANSCGLFSHKNWVTFITAMFQNAQVLELYDTQSFAELATFVLDLLEKDQGAANPGLLALGKLISQKALNYSMTPTAATESTLLCDPGKCQPPGNHLDEKHCIYNGYFYHNGTCLAPDFVEIHQIMVLEEGRCSTENRSEFNKLCGYSGTPLTELYECYTKNGTWYPYLSACLWVSPTIFNEANCKFHSFLWDRDGERCEAGLKWNNLLDVAALCETLGFKEECISTPGFGVDDLSTRCSKDFGMVALQQECRIEVSRITRENDAEIQNRLLLTSTALLGRIMGIQPSCESLEDATFLRKAIAVLERLKGQSTPGQVAIMEMFMSARNKDLGLKIEAMAEQMDALLADLVQKLQMFGASYNKMDQETRIGRLETTQPCFSDCFKGSAAVMQSTTLSIRLIARIISEKWETSRLHNTWLQQDPGGTHNFCIPTKECGSISETADSNAVQTFSKIILNIGKRFHLLTRELTSETLEKPGSIPHSILLLLNNLQFPESGHLRLLSRIVTRSWSDCDTPDLAGDLILRFLEAVHFLKQTTAFLFRWAFTELLGTVKRKLPQSGSNQRETFHVNKRLEEHIVRNWVSWATKEASSNSKLPLAVSTNATEQPHQFHMTHNLPSLIESSINKLIPAQKLLTQELHRLRVQSNQSLNFTDLEFYRWRGDQTQPIASRLFNGKLVFLTAPIFKSPALGDAIRFKEIGLNFRFKEKSISTLFEEELVNYRVQLEHGGYSYYRIANKYLLLYDGVGKVYEFGRHASNSNRRDQFGKLVSGIESQSPYTTWGLRLGGHDFEGLAKFGGQSFEIILHGEAAPSFLRNNPGVQKHSSAEAGSCSDVDEVLTQLEMDNMKSVRDCGYPG